MKGFIGLCLVLVLSGCGLKSNTFKVGGHSYTEKREPHSNPVCLLPGALPADLDYTVIGQVRGNRGFFGSFEPVRQVMAEEARSVGADAIANLSMRQKIAFRGIFILRPVGEGTAVKIANPLAFNCLAQGGYVYPGNGRPPVRGALAKPGSAAGSYDRCMARVLKITDPKLRLSSMNMCDGAK